MSATALVQLINSFIIGFVIWFFSYRKWWPYNWKGEAKKPKEKINENEDK